MYPAPLRIGLCRLLGFALLAAPLCGQAPAPLAALQQQVQQLAQALAATQAQLAAIQAEVAALRQQLGGSAPLAARVTATEDQQTIASGQLQTQEQTKVSSGSRFHVTLSGLLLLNLYSNQGTAENSDVPNFAFAAAAPFRSGDLGASVRQSEISLRVEGSEIAGAKSSGEIIADFYGGLPNYLDGSATGLARLKIARGRLDWSHTSLLFGEDTPLISPLSPTSYASLAVPALGYSGNLWTWTPQVALEQRWQLDPSWQATLQAGLLDALSGEFPARTNFRVPEAGEASRQPGFEVHQAISRERYDRPFALGAGAYTSEQFYGFGRNLRAWAATGDWQLALAPWLDLTGEIYRGRAIGGLWAAMGSSIVASNANLADPTTQIAPLNAAGGWSQLTFHLAPTLDLNTAYGLDNSSATNLRRFAALNPTDPLARNHTGLVNLIDRPRSDLIFALEYRHIETFRLNTAAQTAAQLNAAIGVVF